MNDDSSSPEDHMIPTPRGRIFARRWSARSATDTATDTATDIATNASPAPIVLFHDSLGSVDIWRDFPSKLCAATGRDVIAYDRLGFGQSDPRDDVLTLDFVSDEAKDTFPRLREHFGITRFVGMGHSVGGGMAMHCAAEFARDCEALVTIAAQIRAEDRTLEGIRVAKEQFKDPAQLARLARYHGDKAKWVLDAWTESWLDPEFQRWSMIPVLRRVQCPVLVIHGGQDEYGSRMHPDTIDRESAGPSELEWMEEAGHLPHREQTDRTVERIRVFLRALGQQ